MNANRRDLFTLMLAFGLAVAGFAFCVWNIVDASAVPCLTIGCSMQHSFTLGGISLWWFGAGAFTLLGLCAVTGFAAAGRFFSGIMLAGDCALLLLMAVSATCLGCLVIALLLGAEYALFCRAAPHTGILSAALLLIWSACLLMVAGQLVQEAASPWPIASPAHPAQVRAHIYFSPSCGACRMLVRGMPDAEAAQIAWFPVAEHEDDIPVVAAMREALARGATLKEAMNAAQEIPPCGRWEKLVLLPLQIRLWINRGHVLQGGRDALPYVTVYGLPQALLSGQRTRPAGNQPLDAPALPFLDIDTLGECKGGTALPCPEPGLP